MNKLIRSCVVGFCALLIFNSCEENTTSGTSPSGLPIAGSCFYPDEFEMGDQAFSICMNVLEPVPSDFIQPLSENCQSDGGMWMSGCPMNGYAGNCLIDVNNILSNYGIDPEDYPDATIPDQMKMEVMFYSPATGDFVNQWCPILQNGGTP